MGLRSTASLECIQYNSSLLLTVSREATEPE